jgi:multidrug efflux pump
VGISLLLSWVVAVLFTPYIGFKLLKEHAHASHDEEAVYQRGFYVTFRRFIYFCLRQRIWVLGITLAAFVGALVLFKAVPQQFFPASDRAELIVDLWMPEASTFEASQSEVQKLEAMIKGDPDIAAVTSFVGNGAPRFYLPLDAQTPNLNLGEMLVMTKGGEARERVKEKLEKLFAEHFPTYVAASIAWRTVRQLVIRCSSGCMDRTTTRSALSATRWQPSCARSRMCAR